MKAIVQSAYGGPELARYETIERPTPGAKEVLVRVHAAAIDRGTVHLLKGDPYLVRLAFGLRAPRFHGVGFDVAGTIVSVDAKVTDAAPGDEVFGVGKGTLAEFCLAKASKLAAKPENVSFVQAGAVPISGLTALQAVRDHARIESGQHLLINGASGGVGTYAVQIAKARGIEVTGVASTAKLELVRSLGADHVIDYTVDTFASNGPYDAIIDIGGNSPLGMLRSSLKPKGTLVIVGGEGAGKWLGGIDRQLRAHLTSPFVSQRLTSFVSPEKREDLEALAELLRVGDITPSIGETFALADAAKAIADLDAGRARGKLVIEVDRSSETA